MHVGDPRETLARRNLGAAKLILIYTSTKGGVGKTTTATLTALAAARRGLRVGILDADLTNPGVHVVLGIPASLELVEEEEGVKPVRVSLPSGELYYMGAAIYTSDKPLALRGEEAVDALREVLAVTRWPTLDLLIIDTPPGLRDEVLEVLRLAESAVPVVVATPDKLAVRSVERMLEALAGEGRRGILLENMSSEPTLEELARRHGFHYAGPLPVDEAARKAVGNPEELARTRLFNAIAVLLEALLGEARECVGQ